MIEEIMRNFEVAMSLVSIVIPAYNEASNLAAVYERLCRITPGS